MNEYLIIAALTFLITIILSKVAFLKYFHFLLDKPDKIRKFHTSPTPLIGGLIILIVLFIYNLLLNQNYNFYFLIFLLVFFLVGFMDDVFDLSPYLKLSILILIILFYRDYLIFEEVYFYEFGIIKLNSFFSYIFFILSILLFINASNMMDGIDGAALTYYISLLLILSINISSTPKNVFIILLVIYSILLIFNLYKKIFIGDSGIYLSAILFSYYIINEHKAGIMNNFQENFFYAENIFLMMFLPGIDMLRLFFYRVITRNSPFKADRNHFHHLLKSKFNSIISLMIINTFYFFPILSSLFLQINKFIIIIIFIVLYSILVIFLQNAKNN